MNIKQIAESILGRSGKMISGSKSLYREVNPLNVSIFNANVVVETDSGLQKVWYGDLDLTLEEKKLIELSTLLGKKVYVIREMDGRFDNENSPIVSNAVYSVHNGISEHEKYVSRFKYNPPKPPVPENSLVDKDVAENWDFRLVIKQPEPTYQESVAKALQAQSHFKQEDYIKLEFPEDTPSFCSFLENCTRELSPYLKFQDWLKVNFGMEISTEPIDFNMPILNESDYEDLYKAQKAWMEVLNPYTSIYDSGRDPRYWGPDKFYGAPEGFSSDPDWVEENCMYIRKGR